MAPPSKGYEKPPTQTGRRSAGVPGTRTASSQAANLFLGGPSHQCMVYDEDDDRSDNGDENTPQVDTGDSCRTKRRKDRTANQSTDYSQDNVTEQAFATLSWE